MTVVEMYFTSFSSVVERMTVVGYIGIIRSLVRFQQRGILYYENNVHNIIYTDGHLSSPNCPLGQSGCGTTRPPRSVGKCVVNNVQRSI